MNHGISTLQPVHQVAQKSSSTTLPLSDESLTGLPSRPGRLKSVASLRAAGFAISAESVADAARRSAAAAMNFLIQSFSYLLTCPPAGSAASALSKAAVSL